MISRTKIDLRRLVCSVGFILFSTNVFAANWLLLQGTEVAGTPPGVKLWGFIQPELQYTKGTKLKAGAWAGQDAVFNLQRPDLVSESGFNVIRARLGARGVGVAQDNAVNYFFLAEAGNNGITKSDGGSVKTTDASVTLNHIKGARIRVGQFKYPASEEGLQAIHVFDYINFTNVSNQLMLERFFDSDGSVASMDANKPNGPVNAYRDIGIQVFDVFTQGHWDHSYAVMVGNGNGITRGDNNAKKDIYLYWSSERIYGGKGPRREGWKLYAWHINGKRTIKAGPSQLEAEFDRSRYGMGSTYRKGKYRVSAEFIKADGMIQYGTDGGAVPGSLDNTGVTVASFNMLPKDQADGWYLDFGYKIHPKCELDIRYDHLNLATDTTAGERNFKTLTFGTQYLFSKNSRVLINYEIRDAGAPGFPSSAQPSAIMDSMDDRSSVQLLMVF